MRDPLALTQKLAYWTGLATIYAAVVVLLVGIPDPDRLARSAILLLIGAGVSMASALLPLFRAGVARGRARGTESRIHTPSTGSSTSTGSADESGTLSVPFSLQIRRKAISAIGQASAVGLLFVLTPPVLEALSLAPQNDRGPLFWAGATLMALALTGSLLLGRFPPPELARLGAFAAYYLTLAAALLLAIALLALSVLR